MDSVIDSTEERAPALCAVHEGALATGTCARCGDNVCPLCVDPDSELPGHCAACREREGEHAMPWERAGEGWFVRWWRTTREVLTAPTVTLNRVEPGSLKKALGYVVATGAIIGLAMTLVGLVVFGVSGLVLLARGAYGTDALQTMGMYAIGSLVSVVLYPLLLAGYLVVAVLVRALVFHGGVRLAGGGRGGLRTSVWIVCYLQGIQIVNVPLAILSYIPVAGPLVTLFGYLAVEIWFATQLTTSARRHHRLEGRRGAFAGWFGFAILFVLGGLCLAGSALYFVLAALGQP